MNCPRCGNPVASRQRSCDNCGCDLQIYRKIVYRSNTYYNEGLERAKVRDMGGAVTCLKRSLELNKHNTDARNLLGLIYYETGEIVPALSQWVISKNLDPNENDADYFIERVQDASEELDNFSNAVRKYNLALEAARSHNIDTAIIQLRKAVSLYPNFVKAQLLLALLYIENGEPEKARKPLARVKQTDATNAMALRYEKELNMTHDEGSEADGEWNHSNPSSPDNPGRGIVHIGSYKEDKPNVIPFVNLLIGVVIGILVVYYLIVPTIKTNIREEYDSQKVDYSAELASLNASVEQKDNSIDSLNRQIEALEEQLEEARSSVEEVVITEGSYDEFFDVWEHYKELKASEYTDSELQELALELWSLNDSSVTNEYAASILAEMREDIYPLAARKIYRSGRDLFDAGDYESAAGMLQAAVDLNSESDAAMYYLGKSYQALGQYEQAIYYYRLMLEKFPNSTLKDYIPQRLRECGAEE